MNSKFASKRAAQFLLILTAMMPSLCAFSFWGIHFNIERIILPLLAYMFLFNSNRFTGRKLGKLSFSILLFLIYWILYGLFLTLISNYVNLKESIKELSTLVFGVLLIFSFMCVCSNPDDIYQCISISKKILWIILFIAIIEILTGWHLSTSCYNDPEFIDSMLKIYGYVPAVKSATGFQYGVNDFAAFIALFSPLFFINLRTKYFWINWIGWGICFIITLKNDAIISAISMIIGLVFYWIFKKHSRVIKKTPLIIGFLITLISLLLIWRKNILLSWNLSSIVETVKVQLANRNTYGSSSNLRLQIYKDTLKSIINSKYIGMGPSSLQNYFQVYPSTSRLVDPHNLWLEIMSQYGIMIFLFYIIILLYLGVRLYRKYQSSSQPLYLAFASVLVIYIFVSLAPSTFLGYLYQWLGIAFCIVLLEKKKIVRR